MKRLLLEADCTVLERSLLTSIALDVPAPRTLEKVRAAVAREEETAIVPAVAARRALERPSKYRRAAAFATFGLAAAFGVVLIVRDHRPPVAQVEPEPIPLVTAPAPSPLPEPAASALPPASAFEPAMQVQPPAIPSPPRSSTAVRTPPTPSALTIPRAGASSADVDCTSPYWYDQNAVKHYKPACLAYVPPTPSIPPTASTSSTPSAASSRGVPFDKGAAASALGHVDLTDCKAIAGPDGSGHVTVTFATDGTVLSAVVDSGPFPGTARGGCIAAKFKGVFIPPFDGTPVRVGKSFTVQ